MRNTGKSLLSRRQVGLWNGVGSGVDVTQHTATAPVPDDGAAPQPCVCVSLSLSLSLSLFFFSLSLSLFPPFSLSLSFSLYLSLSLSPLSLLERGRSGVWPNAHVRVSVQGAGFWRHDLDEGFKLAPEIVNHKPYIFDGEDMVYFSGAEGSDAYNKAREHPA